MINETEVKKHMYPIVPSANIVETPTSYIVTLDIPGAVKENIKANIENSSLMISADIDHMFQSEHIKHYRREFSLADNIDVNTVNAQYELGVLTVTLNKKVQYLPKQITIN
jgi:HSP20 family protein